MDFLDFPENSKKMLTEIFPLFLTLFWIWQKSQNRPKRLLKTMSLHFLINECQWQTHLLIGAWWHLLKENHFLFWNVAHFPKSIQLMSGNSTEQICAPKIIKTNNSLLTIKAKISVLVDNCHKNGRWEKYFGSSHILRDFLVYLHLRDALIPQSHRNCWQRQCPVGFFSYLHFWKNFEYFNQLWHQCKIQTIINPIL